MFCCHHFGHALGLIFLQLEQFFNKIFPYKSPLKLLINRNLKFILVFVLHAGVKQQNQNLQDESIP